MDNIRDHPLYIWAFEHMTDQEEAILYHMGWLGDEQQAIFTAAKDRKIAKINKAVRAVLGRWYLSDDTTDSKGETP